MKQEPKTATADRSFIFRDKNGVLTLLKQAAESEDMSQSAFVRQAIRERARRVLLGIDRQVPEDK